MISQIVPVASISEHRIGAAYLGDGRCEFRVWAPSAREIAVELYSPDRRTVALRKEDGGYWCGVLDEVRPGARYKYRLNGTNVWPDPASRSQPEGVHEASEVVDPDFNWTASWHGLPVEDYILYELHVGTFTFEGTFDAAAEQLQRLRDLGITAIEIMPVAQFPGSRNWGYDGVYPFAVQNSYGGPAGLRRFVDQAHQHGLAVVLDVVYNHLGPEGNYFGQFGPYFTDRYQTPWGQAINFDGPDGHGVRDYFIQNAVYWVRDFQIDGLRLDAVHAIYDNSPHHILAEMAEAVHSYGHAHQRTITVIAESDLNEARLVRSGDFDGYGLDAQWSDDFHHALHTVLTGERGGYYQDFGGIQDLAKAMSNGFVYCGQHSVHRCRPHGTDASDLPGRTFVVCSQNHDQIGNRMMGERLSHLVAPDDARIAAGVLLLSPFVPLLFMGQEYAETSPFLYFVSHSDPGLVQAVRDGRKREFASFAWLGEVPDAQDEATFMRSKLHLGLWNESWHGVMLEWYRTLIAMRRQHPAMHGLNRQTTDVEVVGSGHTIMLRRWAANCELIALFHFSDSPETVTLEAAGGAWRKVLDSSEQKWLGGGSAIPDSLDSQGTLQITLPAKSCVVLEAGATT
jgi:maltooligosyltrehalose trehalohydrolase